MALIVEEEKSGVNIGATLTWFTVIVVIGLLVYYIFFQNPEYIELIPPSGFRETTKLSEIRELNVGEVIDNPAFRSLKPVYTVFPRSGNAGRANPFLSF